MDRDNIKILITDDDPSIRDSFADYLEELLAPGVWLKIATTR